MKNIENKVILNSIAVVVLALAFLWGAMQFYAYKVQEAVGATILLTPTTSTIGTFRTNVNTSLTNLNAAASQDLFTTSSPTFASTTLSNFTIGSVPFFAGGGALFQDNPNFFFLSASSSLRIGTSTVSEASHLYIEVVTGGTHAAILRAASSQTAHIFMIEASDGTDLFTVAGSGETEVLHTATEDGDHAIHVESDAAGFGGVNGLFIDYDTGAISIGEDENVILLTIDRFSSTGGDVHGVQCTATTGAADASCLSIGAGVNVFEQASGVFGNMASASSTAGGDVRAAFISTLTDVTIFASNNDEVIIGNATQFSAIEVILDTNASGAGVKPTFEFSTSTGEWLAFSPTDGTDGFRDSGNITWELSDIPSWAVGNESEFWIRITRTQSGLGTAPIEDIIQISSVTEFFWDLDARAKAASISITGTSTFTGNSSFLATLTSLNITATGNIVIPNGATCDSNATGELCHDTDGGDQLIFGNENVLTSIHAVSMTIPSSTFTNSSILLGKLKNGITVTQVDCIVDPAGSAEGVILDIDELDADGDNPVTLLGNGKLNCINTNLSTTTFTNAVLDINDYWSIDPSAGASSTVDFLTVTIRYTDIRQ